LPVDASFNPYVFGKADNITTLQKARPEKLWGLRVRDSADRDSDRLLKGVCEPCEELGSP
jgi:hypothetical protein